MLRQPLSGFSCVLLAVCALMRSAAQPACDPVTQYVDNTDGCCRMCPPGTSMTSLSTCTEPNCSPCGNNEYQDKYTTEQKCTLQPYCDPNKNFKAAVHTSKKSRTTCLCEEGFHCSSKECITCIPHTSCPPGEGAVSIGDHAHDTVCKECPEGSFSDESSWSGACKQWTVCKTGFYVSQRGTARSDNTCVESGPSPAAYVVPILVIMSLLVAVGVFLCKVKPELFKRVAKCCMKSTHLPIEAEQDPEAPIRIERITPEENEDDDSILTGVPLTDNGNVLVQENGKLEQLSRQESQTECSQVCYNVVSDVQSR
ncbi:tumor necrosis factor receptor superfamily member 5 isoform X2 [Parambassis ranga]|uniref:Tumor necrosis factor receptor superfamily member 5 isoform X2 n=1 Tax=Parambassis ranga TaxID=210632 RepID=A0A6P7IQ44_9TELE|nr:tumor necrosis factor receptor superfamily member 5-like isoform X2 [Parambassis ranga]